MRTLQIKTAQNVNVEFNLANVGQRLLAFIIDNVLKFAYLWFIAYAFDWSLVDDNLTDDGWSVRAIDVMLFLPVTFYSLCTELLLDGQTIGKRLLKIRVINVEGFKASTTDFIMRWFLRVVDFNSFSLVVIYLFVLNIVDWWSLVILLFYLGKMVGFILILTSKNNQRFGDMIANTIVINLKDSVEISQTILENLSNEYTPTYPNVIKLSDNDARIIKDNFKQALISNDYNTLIKLRTKIIEVTRIKSKHNNDKDFIGTVLKDYNYYTQNM